MHRSGLGFVAQIVGQGIQGRAAQIQARIECALHLHIKPRLNGTRHKLVRDPINQETRNEAHHHKNEGQFGQQPGAKFAGTPAEGQAYDDPKNHTKQEGSHHRIEHKERGVILLVEVPSLGRLGQKEQEHHPEPQNHKHPHTKRPAQGFL